MSLLHLLLVVVLIALLVGVLPIHGYSAGYGYWPGGILGTVLVVVLVLFLLGRL